MTLIKRGMAVYQGPHDGDVPHRAVSAGRLTTQYFGNVSQFGDMAAILAVATICIGAAAHQAWSANLFTTVSDMFPKKAVARVTGIGTTAGGIGGVVVPQLPARSPILPGHAADGISHHVHHLRIQLSDRVGHHEGARAAGTNQSLICKFPQMLKSASTGY